MLPKATNDIMVKSKGFRLSCFGSVKQEQEENGFLEQLVQRFDTVLFSPESVIVKQGDMSAGIYFIAGGDCAIRYIDHKDEVHLQNKLLVESDHFGEISVVYNCPA